MEQEQRDDKIKQYKDRIKERERELTMAEREFDCLEELEQQQAIELERLVEDEG